MKLISIKYKLTTDSTSNDWILEELNLNGINLIVGQNAIGKSSVIRLLIKFSKLINNQIFIYAHNQTQAEWSLIFLTDKNEKLEYDLTIEYERDIYSEYLRLNGQLLLDRNSENTSLYSYKEQKLVKIKPPSDRLVLHIRRDIDEYPYFENLIEWAQGVILFEFSKVRPFYSDTSESPRDSGPYPNLIWGELNPESKKIVINDLNNLSFKIANIYLDDFNFKPDSKALYLLEEGLNNRLSEYQLSQGMFRALTLIVYVQHVIQFRNKSMILVDDLGEGLDYERATKLGKLLVEKLENSNIQFIATSNDSFLMDVIPIKYWNILQRDGNTVSSLNYQNSKERFDKFLMTGLSNFDLFSSDYLMRPKP